MGSDEKWHFDAPDPGDLECPVTDADLATISRKLARFRVANGRWQEFLTRRRLGDELWHFHAPLGFFRIAIVRNRIPVAQFQHLYPAIKFTPSLLEPAS
jgi:hypothetical protein